MSEIWTHAHDTLSKKDPQLAAILENTESQGLTLCETRKGEPNLLDTRGVKQLYLHSNYCAANEMTKWRNDLDLSASKVLFIYGVDLGYSLMELRDWVEAEADRYLVYLAPDLPVLRKVLETEQGAALAVHAQVMLVGLEDNTDETLQSVAQELAYYYVGLPFQVAALPFYQHHAADKARRFHLHMMHSAAYVNFACQEFMDYGQSFFRNFYVNLLKLPKSAGASGLYKQFEGVPAIICGAGPSLNKQLELLGDLRDRALIFAGGSAINALLDAGIEPHFGASVDPNPLQARRMQLHAGFELPIFYKGRVFYRALQTLHGPKLYLNGNNGYPITKWIEKQLNIEGDEAIEGHNCLHLLIDIARRMGCGPILFVGMDLAFTNMQQYASGVVDDADVSKEQITKASNINDNAFPRKDIYGEEIYTLWKWVSESDYTSAYAKQYPDHMFINCTEGGLGFEGIANQDLADAVDAYLQDTWDLDGRVHAAIQSEQFDSVSQESVLNVMGELRSSLCDASDTCAELDEAFDGLAHALKKGRVAAIEKAESKIRDIQEKLEQETAYTYIMQPVNHVRSVLFERQFEEAAHAGERQSELSRLLTCVSHQQDEVRTLRECAHLNRLIMDAAVRELQDQGYSLEWKDD